MGDLIFENVSGTIVLLLAILSFFVRNFNIRWRVVISILSTIVFSYGVYSSFGRYNGSVEDKKDKERDKKDKERIKTELVDLKISDSISRSQNNDILIALKDAKIKYDPASKMIINNNQTFYYGIIPRKITKQKVIAEISKATDNISIDKNTYITFFMWGSMSEDAEIVSVKNQIASVLKKLGYTHINFETHYNGTKTAPDDILCFYDSIDKYLGFVIPFAK